MVTRGFLSVTIVALCAFLTTSCKESTPPAAQPPAAAQAAPEPEKAAAPTAAEMEKMKAEKAAAEEAARKAEEEKLELQRRQIRENVAGMSKEFLDAKRALEAHYNLWKPEGDATKTGAIESLLKEFVRAEEEMAGIKALIMQDDLAKATTALELSKSTFSNILDKARSLLADRPAEMDPTVRAVVLELIAKESCLQRERNRGKLTDMEMITKRNEELQTAGYAPEKYELLRAKINNKPQPTDATVIGANMEKLCPLQPAADEAAPAGTDAAAPAAEAVPATEPAPAAPAATPAEAAPATDAAKAEAAVEPVKEEAPDLKPVEGSSIFSGSVKSKKWGKGVIKVRRTGKTLFGSMKFGNNTLTMSGTIGTSARVTAKHTKDIVSCQVIDQNNVLSGSCSGTVDGKKGDASFNLKESGK